MFFSIKKQEAVHMTQPLVLLSVISFPLSVAFAEEAEVIIIFNFHSGHHIHLRLMIYYFFAY